MFIENATTEFTRKYSENMERTVIAFVNSSGGKLFIGMDNDGTSDNIVNGKALRVKGKPCIALVSEHRQKITCMLRMLFIGRVVVTARLIKGDAAVAKFVDVHSIKVGGAFCGYIWQSEKLCID